MPSPSSVTTLHIGVPSLPALLRRYLLVLVKKEGTPRSLADDQSTTSRHTSAVVSYVHSLLHHVPGRYPAGASVFEVARRLGHSSTATTERVYAHLLPRQDDTAARALDHLLAQ